MNSKRINEESVKLSKQDKVIKKRIKSYKRLLKVKKKDELAKTKLAINNENSEIEKLVNAKLEVATGTSINADCEMLEIDDQTSLKRPLSKSSVIYNEIVSSKYQKLDVTDTK